MNQALILASKSPRRQQLLAQLGYQFTTSSADIDESVVNGETPKQYVRRLAIAKAQVIAKENSQAVVLGSDTAVVIDNEILGKPGDQQDCIAMLKKLSGRQHQVLTSIALVQGKRVESQVVTTEVFFKTLSEQEMLRYWQSEEPKDKAGSYGIQGLGAQFVHKIQGCYFAVVGLPLYQSAQMLAAFGLPTAIQGNEKEIS